MTPTASASVFSLTQYQGKNRILLVFTPSETDERFQQQQLLFERHQPDIVERDLLVLPIIGANENRVRCQFRIATSEFAVVLIGKDGAEKHRWSGIAPVDQISHRIDRMPMRRVEMRTSQSDASDRPTGK